MEKEKLQLKHLAPYLPYGLKGYYEKDKTTWTLDCELNQTDYQMKSLPLFHFIGVGHCKPILRPLSDYIEEKELTIMYESILEAPYYVIEDLLKAHVDIFGLIEKGIAIDINTLTKP